MIKFKIDENLPVEIADILKTEGYDSETVTSEKLSGSSDKIISKVCKKEERTLITLDLDFSDIRTYPPHKHPGFIVLRLKRQDKKYVIENFKSIIPILNKEKIENKLWIMIEDSFPA